jgi:uncharacterized protein YecT (DUF1311 family)
MLMIPIAAGRIRKTAAAASLLMLLVSCGGAFAEQPKILLVSPKGTFQIEMPPDEAKEPSENEEENATEWIVSTRDPRKRAPIPRANAQPVYDFSFSPDEKWFAVNVHYGSRMAGFRMYHVKEGPKLERALDEELGWKWLDHNKVDAMSAADMMRHTAWSFDSSRLLLRIPMGGEAIATGAPTANFFFYYNVRSQRFEMTDYLRNLNANASSILKSGKPARLITEAQAAEPIDAPPPPASSHTRYEAADSKLNEVYGKLMRKLKPDDQTLLRDDQRKWIKLRDAGANAFSSGRKKSLQPAYGQLYLAEATEQRVRDLEVWLERTGD